MAISLTSNNALTLQGSGEVTWGMSLSDIASKINAAVPDDAEITKVTLNFSGTAYNNSTLLYTANDYAVCGLTNSDSDAITNTSGGTGGTNLFKQGPFRVNSKETKNLDNQSIDITKYFGARTPHSVQNTSYSRLTVAFSSQSTYKKIYTFSLSIDVTYQTIPDHIVTVTILPADGGTVTGAGTYKQGTQATVTAVPSEGYKFSGWANQSGVITVTTNPYSFTVNNATTFNAVFEKLTYTVTFKDDSGTTLKTESVAYGGKPTPPTAPTKAGTAQWKYTFDGWYDANGNKWTSSTTITAATTYTARYTSTVQKYTIRWYNHDGTLLETDTDVPYGTKPTYNGATPTKPSDDYYTYGFAGWSPSITEGIQGDKNFTAQFAQTDRYYTVRWVNASAVQGVEGTLLETDEVKFNTQPDYNGATPKHPKQDTDPAFNYDFIGWSAKVTDPAKPDTELEKVKGNITYTAIYETTPKLYAVTVILFGNSQSTDIYEYGTEITIEAPEVVDFHRFIKWSDGDTNPSRVVTVTGEATYQAVYERIPIPIKVNLEQVTGVYIVPDINTPNTGTIVYVINGTVPTVETKTHTVDGWHFLVSNTIPDNSYPLEKLFISDVNGTTRIY